MFNKTSLRGCGSSASPGLGLPVDTACHRRPRRFPPATAAGAAPPAPPSLKSPPETGIVEEQKLRQLRRDCMKLKSTINFVRLFEVTGHAAGGRGGELGRSEGSLWLDDHSLQ
ncbi:hypothetical protein E2C01_019885 [Portunus trituberculatus]|uniref:Uncharacterized protein n=1 Tax=Portunus trituberculatus TaxID=210409 RepID=A0A5B7DZ48_PORTR|nr:hypothetical protein [Portunus trituberculatus]